MTDTSPHRATTVVIPMAGRGQRFIDAGFTVPKPLIDVAGRPMYSWAVESIPRSIIGRLIFVCLREHLVDYGLDADIEDRFAHHDLIVVGLDEVTSGQAATVLAARSEIDPERPLLIYNADTRCTTDLATRLPQLGPRIDGLIGVFRAPGDHWSFARTDADGRVLETAEKRRISPWATTGLYHFTRAEDFLTHAEATVASGDRSAGEHYVAPLYNRLIAEGAHIVIDEARSVWPLGTPEELEVFLQGQREDG